MTANKWGVNTDEYDAEVYDAARELTEQQEAARLVTSQDIRFVLYVMKKEAPYDEVSIKQLFYGMCSGFTKVPVHHNVNSKVSGAGKSYLLVLVAGYFPDKYVISLTGMSNKALLHEQGILVMEDEITGEAIPVGPHIQELEVEKEELEVKKPLNREDRKRIKELQAELTDIKREVQKLIILDNRIILILDTAQEDLFNALMSMISQDTQKDQKYEFVDRSGSGSIGTKINRLRGTPVIFTCQVIDDTRQIRFHEKNRRFVHVTPDTSDKKIQSAIDLIGLRHGLLPDEYDQKVVTRQDKEKAKKIIDRIVRKLVDHSKHLKPKESGVKIAFTKTIGHAIEGDPNDVWRMTVMERTMRYLDIITKVNMDSRPRLIPVSNTEIEEGAEEEFYPIATFQDLQETLQLMGMASSTIRPYIADWYNKVFIPAYKSLDGKPNDLRSANGYTIASEIHVGVCTEQLAEKTKQIMHTNKPSSDDLLKSYLYPLLNLGIIDKAQSTIDKRANIYFPVEDGNIFSLFQNGNLSLKVTDPFLYPSKTVLEKEFRTFVKYYYNEGVPQKNNTKYKLVDADGTTEITVQQLLDRYFSNPQICFEKGYTVEQEQQYTAEREQRPVINNLSYVQQVAQKTASLMVHPAWSNIPRQFSNNSLEEPITEHRPTGSTSIADPSATALIADCKERVADPLIAETYGPERRGDLTYSCDYCRISRSNGRSLTSFDSLDLKERHVIKKHSGWTAYPGSADIQKFEGEHKEKQQQKRRKEDELS